eukprot:scaffold3625_cov372-Prasinococcus_capsulatus_cf.AAC.1
MRRGRSRGLGVGARAVVAAGAVGSSVLLRGARAGVVALTRGWAAGPRAGGDKRAGAERRGAGGGGDDVQAAVALPGEAARRGAGRGQREQDPAAPARRPARGRARAGLLLARRRAQPEPGAHALARGLRRGGRAAARLQGLPPGGVPRHAARLRALHRPHHLRLH